MIPDWVHRTVELFGWLFLGGSTFVMGLLLLAGIVNPKMEDEDWFRESGWPRQREMAKWKHETWWHHRNKKHDWDEPHGGQRG